MDNENKTEVKADYKAVFKSASKAVLKAILSVLIALKIFDKDHTASLTNIFLYVVIAKIYQATDISTALCITSFFTLVRHAYKAKQTASTERKKVSDVDRLAALEVIATEAKLEASTAKLTADQVAAEQLVANDALNKVATVVNLQATDRYGF